ncbi:MAG TPA: 30S ribosomal protein S5 [Candidatus Paceibacterota bacterium]|nr:30S ribosomal protein S5 [Candidatus Paceibacterota bacterium]HMO82696.1 30S ribosomal protein S5 [Candidatus Paceibacterota bacterium]
MSETKQEATTDLVSDTEATTVSPSTDAPAVPEAETKGDEAVGERSPRGRRGQAGTDRRNQRRPRRGGRPERVRPEFDQKIISIRRVTRVVTGGRRFAFSVAMVIGDRRGKVGVGIGKAGDTQQAIEKAVRDAKKHMITVTMNKEGHLPHDVHTKYASSEVMIIPAPGRGLVAGSSVRTVLEHAGVKDVTAKIFSRSKNKLNNARAAIEALKLLKKK